jgi:hypothetical protein
VVLLLGQVRRLRREIATTGSPPPAVPSAAQPPVAEPDRLPEPVRTPTPVTDLVTRRDQQEVSPAPSQQQIVTVTLAHPLVRVSAFAYGLRRALRPENRDRLQALVRRDLRRRHKIRRAAARRAARVVPIRTAASDDREVSAS